MRTSQASALLVLSTATLLPFAWAQPMISDGLLIAHTGHSLYTFDNDVAGSETSVCNPPCSNIFPPYLGAAKDTSIGDFTLITRQDGSKQWAHRGRPLYRFYADEKPGDKGGDGMNRNLWHLAQK